MPTEEFLSRLDKLYEDYLQTNQGDVDAEFSKQCLFELLLEYKGGGE